MILNSYGIPVHRTIGFISSWAPNRELHEENIVLASAIGCSEVSVEEAKATKEPQR